jgi:hypothetical protein
MDTPAVPPYQFQYRSKSDFRPLLEHIVEQDGTWVSEQQWPMSYGAKIIFGMSLYSKSTTFQACITKYSFLYDSDILGISYLSERSVLEILYFIILVVFAKKRMRGSEEKSSGSWNSRYGVIHSLTNSSWTIKLVPQLLICVAGLVQVYGASCLQLPRLTNWIEFLLCIL